MIKGDPWQGLGMEVDLTCHTQLYFGFLERELHRWLKKLSVGIDTAIDTDACDGEYTLYFLAKTSAKVFVFEPVVSNRTRLMANLS